MDKDWELSESSGGSRIDPDVEEGYATARRLGLVAFTAHDRLLQLDLDGMPTRAQSEAEIVWLQMNETRGVMTTTSKSGNHHRYYWLKEPMGQAERIALQAAFGSDPIREMLSLERHLKHPLKPALLLFETELEAARVWLWREEMQKAEKADEAAAESSHSEVL